MWFLRWKSDSEAFATAVGEDQRAKKKGRNDFLDVKEPEENNLMSPV